MRIQVLLYPGIDDLDAVGPLEVLSVAERAGAPWTVAAVASESCGVLQAASGLQLYCGDALPDAGPGRPDVLIVPGGGWSDHASRGVMAEVLRGDLPRRLAALHDGGTILAAVCTGAMLLAGAGLLQGRPATTHHGAIGALASFGAVLTDARVVDDGDVITSGGVTSGLDLGLWLVERFGGRPLAQAVATRIEYERRGPIWQRPVATVT